MNHYSWFGGIYDEPKNMFPNFAVDPETVDEVWPDYRIAPDALARFKHVRNGALVGEDTMRKFGWHVGQNVTLKGTIFPVDLTFEIVGTIPAASPTRRMLWFNRKYLERGAWNRAAASTRVGMIWLRAATPGAGRRHHRAGRRALPQLRGRGRGGDREGLHRELHEHLPGAACASS